MPLGAKSFKDAVWFDTNLALYGFAWIGDDNYIFNDANFASTRISSGLAAMENMFAEDLAQVQQQFKSASGALFMGYPDNLAQKAFEIGEKRFLQSEYFYGRQTGNGALVDANWIIDVGVGVGSIGIRQLKHHFLKHWINERFENP